MDTKRIFEGNSIISQNIKFGIYRHDELVTGQVPNVPLEILFADARHNLYLVLFSGKGGATHNIDGKTMKIPPYSVLFVGPDRLSSFTQTPSKGTHILIFSSLFYNRSTRDAHSLLNSPLFHHFGMVYTLTPPDESVIYCKTLAYLLHTAKENFANPLHQDLVHNIIQQILIMGILYGKKNINLSYKDHQDNALVLAFRKAIEENHIKEKTVRFYADLLNVTERKLSNATDNILNITAKDLITRHIMEEAKWQLIYRNESIKEISSDLGFSEEHNFSAFFKKNEKTSPKEFRKKHQTG